MTNTTTAQTTGGTRAQLGSWWDEGPKSVATQATELAEALTAAGNDEDLSNAGYFRGEVVPVLAALLTAVHWSGQRSLDECQAWIDSGQGPEAVLWLERHLTRRVPNPETGDPGSSREELVLWAKAQAKLDTWFQEGAGGQAAGALSTLAQILETE